MAREIIFGGDNIADTFRKLLHPPGKERIRGQYGRVNVYCSVYKLRKGILIHVTFKKYFLVEF